MKKLFTLFLLAILPLVANAYFERVKINGVCYYRDMDSGEIGVGANDEKYSGDIVIPETIISDGVEYKVEFIGECCFENCVGLTSITIGNNVKRIGRDAFSGCTNLTSVTFGTGLTKIGPACFSGCSSLMKVTIPNGITTLSPRLFENCGGLISVTIPESVTSIENHVFSGCGGLISLIIPENVTSIGTYAFWDCKSLTTMTIPPSVKEMGDGVFSNCSSLSTVTIPNSLTSINTNTFSGCTSLTSLTIPSSVLSIGDNAFSRCEKLTSITVPENVTSIGQSAFSGCYELTTVSLPSTLKLIKAGTFQYCYALETITIPATVEYIYQDAFGSCSSLSTVESLAETPPFIYANSFPNYDISLIVPEGSVDAYKAAENWGLFMEIIASKDGGGTSDDEGTSGDEDTSEEKEAITITSAEQTTYCSENDLDFTNVEGLKAYTAGGYNRATGTIWLMRVYEVPAGEGILLIGAPGDYKIPQKTTSTYYANLMVGTLEAKTIYETDGEYTNYYLSSGTHGVGFYKVNGSVEIKANRAYLPLLKSSASGTRGFIGMDFDDDEDGTTGIEVPLGQRPLATEGTQESSIFNLQSNEVYYNLQGQRVDNPGKGVFIKNGRKVVIK